MRLYCVAIRENDKTDVKFFTSYVQQKKYFKDVKSKGAWMYGPVEFDMNAKGIIKALEYGKKSIDITTDNCDEGND